MPKPASSGSPRRGPALRPRVPARRRAAFRGVAVRLLFSLGLLFAAAASLLLLRYLPRLPFGRRLILDTGLSAGEGYASAPEEDRSWLGKSGTTLTPLRPAGIADIGGQRVDVVSDGEFVESGAPITVSRVDGNRIVVRRQRT